MSEEKEPIILPVAGRVMMSKSGKGILLFFDNPEKTFTISKTAMEMLLFGDTDIIEIKKLPKQREVRKRE